MGWTYHTRLTKGQKGEFIQEILRDLGSAGTVLRHCCVSNHLWCIVAFTDKTTGQPRRIITLDLLEFGGPGHGWGHQGMEESCHPFAYDCPLTYLDQVPEACAAWRAGVRKHHANMHITLTVGATYQVTGSWKIRNDTIVKALVCSLKPAIAVFTGASGQTYRTKIPNRMRVAMQLPPLVAA